MCVPLLPSTPVAASNDPSDDLTHSSVILTRRASWLVWSPHRGFPNGGVSLLRLWPPPDAPPQLGYGPGRLAISPRVWKGIYREELTIRGLSSSLGLSVDAHEDTGPESPGEREDDVPGQVHHFSQSLHDILRWCALPLAVGPGAKSALATFSGVAPRCAVAGGGRRRLWRLGMVILRVPQCREGRCVEGSRRFGTDPSRCCNCRK